MDFEKSIKIFVATIWGQDVSLQSTIVGILLADLAIGCN